MNSIVFGSHDHLAHLDDRARFLAPGRGSHMTSTEADFSPVRFATDDLPERDAVAMFRDVIGHKIARLDLEPTGDGPFRCETVLRALPGLGLGSIVTSAQYVRRTKELIAADGNDDLVLTVLVKGTAFLSQLGREATVADGDAFCCATPNRAWYATHLLREFSACVCLPRHWPR